MKNSNKNLNNAYIGVGISSLSALSFIPLLELSTLNDGVNYVAVILKGLGLGLMFGLFILFMFGIIFFIINLIKYSKEKISSDYKEEVIDLKKEKKSIFKKIIISSVFVILVILNIILIIPKLNP